MVVPPKHPKMIIFSRENQGLLGTVILGNPHIDLCAKNRPGKSSNLLHDMQRVCHEEISSPTLQEKKLRKPDVLTVHGWLVSGVVVNPKPTSFHKKSQAVTWSTHQDEQQKTIKFLFMNCWHRFIGLNFSPKERVVCLFALIHPKFNSSTLSSNHQW